MYDIAVIPGDGIGPEVMKVTLDLLEVLNVQFNFIKHMLVMNVLFVQVQPYRMKPFK